MAPIESAPELALRLMGMHRVPLHISWLIRFFRRMEEQKSEECEHSAKQKFRPIQNTKKQFHHKLLSRSKDNIPQASQMPAMLGFHLGVSSGAHLTTEGGDGKGPIKT